MNGHALNLRHSLYPYFIVFLGESGQNSEDSLSLAHLSLQSLINGSILGNFQTFWKNSNGINLEYVGRYKIYAVLPFLWHIWIKHQDTVK